ncbi:MAG: EAL domain-containing protein [Gammaproteobacteria bacterium]|nr:MAG: EAL domain-containing protein [Gammaproteobacteria bacterium]
MGRPGAPGALRPPPQPLPGGLGELSVAYDPAAMEEALARERRWTLGLGGAWLLLALLLTLLAWRRLSRQLHGLADQARRVAMEEPQAGFQAGFQAGRDRAVGRLAEELEAMRRSLVASREASAARERRVQAILDHVPDGILTVDGRGDIASLNRAAAQMFGYRPEEVRGRNINVLLAEPWLCPYLPEGGEDAPPLGPVGRSVGGATGGPARGPAERPGGGPTVQEAAAGGPHEILGRRRDGSTFPLEMRIAELTREEGPLFIAIVRDITERRQRDAELRALQEDLERRVIRRTRELAALNRELEHQALHDALTGLPNRVLFNDRLRQAILAARREARPLALMITDLDRFKEINDTLGHHYGDLVLRQVARRLEGTLRRSDTIARLGGDEFAVLLPSVRGAQDALQAAAKLVAAMERPVELEGQSFPIGLSVGVALFPEHGEDGSTLMRHADVAMYVAKRSGRGYALYDPQEDQHSRSRLALIGDLRRALEEDELFLLYQPKLDLASGALAGLEALVRWRHPTRGQLPPDAFIPLAEHTGLIRPLTLLVLERALAQLQRWRRHGLETTVSVNLSARHLQDQQLPEQVAAQLGRHEIPPQALVLEITESAIMADPERAMRTLSSLAAMGVQLSIDDFGTGYSSLFYLKQLPVHEIKIDKSFTMDMLQNHEDLIIVRSIIDLGHNMGRRVVAEGVETAQALDLLRHLGCDQAQGEHVAGPLGPEGVALWRGPSLHEPLPQPEPLRQGRRRRRGRPARTGPRGRTGLARQQRARARQEEPGAQAGAQVVRHDPPASPQAAVQPAQGPGLEDVQEAKQGKGR